MPEALRFRTIVRSNTLTISDLERFVGKRVEVIVLEDEQPVHGEAHAATNKPARRFGTLAGKLEVADDFDGPLPDGLLRAIRVQPEGGAEDLYPAPLRDLLLRVARAGFVRARWSDAILDECFRNTYAGGEARNQRCMLQTTSFGALGPADQNVASAQVQGGRADMRHVQRHERRRDRCPAECPAHVAHLVRAPSARPG